MRQHSELRRIADDDHDAGRELVRLRDEWHQDCEAVRQAQARLDDAQSDLIRAQAAEIGSRHAFNEAGAYRPARIAEAS